MRSSLIPVFNDAIARRPHTVVDIGAAYGYYALGLAMRLPESRNIACEIDNTRLALLKKYRARNRLANVELRGECTHQRLDADIPAAHGAFILVDIEGSEAELLDPKKIPGLARSEVLVELHEIFAPGVTALLRSRFAATHAQTMLPARRVSLDELDLRELALENCDRKTLAAIIDEERGADMHWLHLLPRSD